MGQALRVDISRYARALRSLHTSGGPLLCCLAIAILFRSDEHLSTDDLWIGSSPTYSLRVTPLEFALSVLILLWLARPRGLHTRGICTLMIALAALFVLSSIHSMTANNMPGVVGVFVILICMAVIFSAIATVIARRSVLAALPGVSRPRRRISRVMSVGRSIAKIHRHDVPLAMKEIILGIGAYLVGSIGLVLALSAKSAADNIPLLWIFGGFFEAAGEKVAGLGWHEGSTLLHDSRAQLGRKADEVVLFDPRPPVVLLRSFQDESLHVEGEVGFLGSILVFLTWKTERGARRLEEVLVSSMKPLGPVVAIARPHAPLETGAEREYVDDDRWQDEIKLWIGRAAIVIVEVGRTAGLQWELGRIIEADAASKLLLVFPATDFVSRVEVVSRLFANTPWASQLTLERLGSSCLAVRLLPDASIAVVSSETSRVLDYTVALQIAASILC
jgi:hypothetical protein